MKLVKGRDYLTRGNMVVHVKDLDAKGKKKVSVRTEAGKKIMLFRSGRFAARGQSEFDIVAVVRKREPGEPKHTERNTVEVDCVAFDTTKAVVDGGVLVIPVKIPLRQIVGKLQGALS